MSKYRVFRDNALLGIFGGFTASVMGLDVPGQLLICAFCVVWGSMACGT